MGSIIDVKNPIEVRKAALRVLNKHLGPEVTRAFMGQTLRRSGDFTAEKYERPQLSFEELKRQIMETQAEIEKEQEEKRE